MLAGKKVEKQSKQKVFVGLSGGVDSSVSAALLLKQGYEVIGVYIKGWYPDFIECNWKEERRDAMRVAAKLGIPFLTCDAEKEYKEFVVDYLVAEYKVGRTPNPDVMCNRHVKFGAFYRFAMERGADFIATGHYVQIKNGELYKGLDENKDQSYFLWGVAKDELAKILFPVGNLQKSETRKLAVKFGLPTASKKDSQGICFLGKISLEEFLEKFIEKKRGRVLNEQGKEIGYHDGAFLFTIGERHGFIITQKGTDDKPYFVMSKNVEKNEIVVSNTGLNRFASGDKNHKVERIGGEAIESVVLREENWLSEIEEDKIYDCRYRYRQALIKCKVVSNKIIFMEAQKLVPEGQSLVLYDGDRCLGGGIIDFTNL